MYLLHFETVTPVGCNFAAAVSAELRMILLNIICKILQFLCLFLSSADDSQFCTEF